MIVVNWYQEYQPEISEKRLLTLEALLAVAAEHVSLEESVELSVTFMSDDSIQKYNQQYRNIDRATDVISFAMEDIEHDVYDVIDWHVVDEPRILGDILISIDRVQEQAKRYGHSFERELGFLVVHGFLHLLGYDHQTPEEEKEMFGLQHEILEAFGLSRFASDE